MYKRIVLFFMFLGLAFGAFAQETDTTKVEAVSYTHLTLPTKA